MFGFEAAACAATIRRGAAMRLETYMIENKHRPDYDVQVTMGHCGHAQLLDVVPSCSQVALVRLCTPKSVPWKLLFIPMASTCGPGHVAKLPGGLRPGVASLEHESSHRTHPAFMIDSQVAI